MSNDALKVITALSIFLINIYNIIDNNNNKFRQNLLVTFTPLMREQPELIPGVIWFTDSNGQCVGSLKISEKNGDTMERGQVNAIT